jgi:hypothetical protein
MNIKRFAAIAGLLVLCAAGVRAQSFEEQYAEVDAAVQRLAQQGRLVAGASQARTPSPSIMMTFAKTIVCAASKEAGLGELKFYTRLKGISSLASLPEEGKGEVSIWNGYDPLKDETAAGLNDYRSSGLSRTKFHYGAWSCDTQDYTFTFDAVPLARRGQEAARAVTGHVLIETRGHVDFDGDLSCLAAF